MTGAQIPRYRIEPERVTTDGADAAALMAAYGNALDEWQQLVLDCWLGRDASGRYTVTSAGLAVPRQNGKNVCLEGREFFGMVINGEKILHTAHQVRTAKKSFNRLGPDVYRQAAPGGARTGEKHPLHQRRGVHRASERREH